jgi:ribonuclease P protein component
MFSKNHTLSRGEIKKFFEEKKGGKYYSPNITLYVDHINNNKPTRFAFVVPKKTIKKAVHRNRLKRRARYIIQKYKKDIKNGYTGIFVFKEGKQEQPFRALELSIVKTLKKTPLL